MFNIFREKILQRAGFTFIELIIVIVIVSVALGTLLLAFSSTINSTVRPAIMQTATQLAEQELERITGTRFSYVCPQASTNFLPLLLFGDYSYTVDVGQLAGASDPTMARYKDVTVKVSNSFIGSVTLNTIITFRDTGGTTRGCPP